MAATTPFSFGGMRFSSLLIRFFIFLAVLLSAYFIFRNTFLQWGFEKAQIYVYKSYGLNLNAESVRFSGFDCILIKNLSLQPDNADTLVSINNLVCNLSLLDLITAKAGLDEVIVNGADVTIYNLTDRNNFHFQSKREKQERIAGSSPSYYKHVAALQTKFFAALHTAFSLRDIHITYTDSALTENIFLPRIDYDHQNLTGLFVNQPSNDSIFLNGKVLKKNKAYQLTIQHRGKANTYLPFLNRDKDLKCKFKTVTATISLNEKHNELLIKSEIAATDFILNHWRLAKEDVVFPATRFTGVLKISDNTIELDSSSTFNLQSVPFKLFASYSRANDTTNHIALNIHMPETVSDTFFRALPSGMFHTLKGISCSGNVAYSLEFAMNTNLPDSLTFLSSLIRKNFRLNHYGAENYARINAPFVYDAYDKERFVRHIIIGNENPMFAPLNRISDYLPKAVLQSEDPSFMQHRGFLPEAFRESIVKNYKEKRFARGGSTISMQLVKNVFLSRDKTISRKVEEALIVYLIENLGLVNKERMLEIYLNVIEWGPDVYGIGEASRFYFSKKPVDLTLQESIFLAGIIPAPKFFRYQFDKQGKLKPTLSGYFRVITSRMAGKGWITPSDTTNLLTHVKLNGPARYLILPNDSINAESEDF